MNIVYLGDCMDAMKEMADKTFDLAIVDPPYGIGRDGQREYTGNPGHNRKKYDFKGWDVIPSQTYFKELERVSSDRIIFGANYFVRFLHASMGWVFWDKGQRGLGNSDGEFIYTSMQRAARVVTFNRKLIDIDGSIHPTQKPVALYKWLLQNYAKPGNKILDTHVGSGSSRIAAWDCGFDFVGYEIDKDYWQAQEDRFNAHKSQDELFDKTEMFVNKPDLTGRGI